MFSTNFLPSKYSHKACGLGKYNNQGDPQVCWDHRAYIVHDIWPYGFVDIKRVSHLRISNKQVRSTEGLIDYLTKYLAKSFQMRQNKELAEKVGLLPGMKVYKFFQATYSYCRDKRYSLKEKISKPNYYSYVFINNEYGCEKKIKRKLAPYFANKLELLKKRKLVLPNSTWQTKEDWQLVDIIRMCLHFATRNYIKENYY
jgi:hypothetical protein